MPKHRPSTAHEDDKYLSTDEDISDPEDFALAWAGLTISEAKSGRKVSFTLPIKTIIFKHAVLNEYCSKRPPTMTNLIDLIKAVSMPMQGYRTTNKFLRSLSAWISNNVSQHNLLGLLVESCDAPFSKPPIYQVLIAPALSEAVLAPNFSYNDILALQDPKNPVNQQHALDTRRMIPYGQPEPRLSMKEVVTCVMSYLVNEGHITPSKKSIAPGAQYPHPDPFFPAQHPLYPATGQPFHSAVFTTSSALMSHMPSPDPAGPSYGSVEHLFEADKVRANQNRSAYTEWHHYVASAVAKAEQSGSARGDSLPADVQAAVRFNKGSQDYDPDHDYVGWLLQHLRDMRTTEE